MVCMRALDNHISDQSSIDVVLTSVYDLEITNNELAATKINKSIVINIIIYFLWF